MSEYQYYEFQSIDHPLTQEERAAISQLSSRAQPTANRVTFTYSYSDLPGDPKTILAKYFDIMYYIANWGTQQLMFRFPKSAISSEDIAPYCFNNCINLSYVKDWAILNWEFSQEEGLGWIEGEGNLTELIGLRQEILSSDYRGLYLAWLKAITLSEEYVNIDKKQLEPPLPPGLAQLSPSQKAFTEIFAVNKHLLTVAATPSTKPIVVSEELFQQAIAQLSSSECRDFLLKLGRVCKLV
jgi:hypothetical protein